MGDKMPLLYFPLLYLLVYLTVPEIIDNFLYHAATYLRQLYLSRGHRALIASSATLGRVCPHRGHPLHDGRCKCLVIHYPVADPGGERSASGGWCL